MNERIKELVKQCTTIVEHGWGASYEQFDKEKFAELIVKECAEIYSINAQPKRPLYPTEFSTALRTHFGIKE